MDEDMQLLYNAHLERLRMLGMFPPASCDWELVQPVPTPQRFFGDKFTMTFEKDAALVRDFPHLYQDRNKTAKESGMCFGFQCGDGWEPLIRELSFKLEKAIGKLPEEERDQYRAFSVKQKFGWLDFYMTMSDNDMDELMAFARAESMQVCEICSKAADRINVGRWFMTLCPVCEETFHVKQETK